MPAGQFDMIPMRGRELVRVAVMHGENFRFLNRDSKYLSIATRAPLICAGSRHRDQDRRARMSCAGKAE
jgi:hypothetical protein